MRTLPSGSPRTDTLPSEQERRSGSESVAAALIYADAQHAEALTDFQPVDAIRDLAVPACLLDACTEIRVSQRDAMLVEHIIHGVEMNLSFEQTLIEVWRQALVEDAKVAMLGTERSSGNQIESIKRRNTVRNC